MRKEHWREYGNLSLNGFVRSWSSGGEGGLEETWRWDDTWGAQKPKLPLLRVTEIQREREISDFKKASYPSLWNLALRRRSGPFRVSPGQHPPGLRCVHWGSKHARMASPLCWWAKGIAGQNLPHPSLPAQGTGWRAGLAEVTPLMTMNWNIEDQSLQNWGPPNYTAQDSLWVPCVNMGQSFPPWPVTFLR